MGKGKTKKKLKALQKKQLAEAEAAMKGIPQSMVFRRGKVGQYVSELVRDMRQVMSPYTAKSLEESKRNSLRDFVSVASPLGVTHFMIFSQTPAGTNLRLSRLPHGPTFTFRINSYCNIRDIVNMQKKPHSPGSEYNTPPLVVLNNFSAAALAQAEELTKQEDAAERARREEEKAASPTSTLLPPTADTLKLTSTMFQNLFPPIDIANLDVKECRRVVILQYEPRDNSIFLRHYLITAAPIGLHKSIKKLLKAKLPDLSSLTDISEFVMKEEFTRGLSDSEAEDAPDAKLTLPQSYHGRGNRAASKSAIRLHELGPRLNLQLMKVSEEMDGGKVLYHYRKSLDEREVEAMARRARQKKEEKARRREQQERNVKRKRGELDETEGAEPLEADPSTLANASTVMGEDEADDDAEWFRKEVGQEPQDGLFDKDDKSNRDFPTKAERKAQKQVRKREAEEKGEQEDEDQEEEEEAKPQKKKQKFAPKAAASNKGKAKGKGRK